MGIQKASKAPFPYGPPARELVLYFMLDKDEGTIEPCRKVDHLIDCVETAKQRPDRYELYGAWPGKARTELFLIDDLDLLESEL